MKIQGKQIFRTEDNLNELFLCPYAYAELTDDGLFISRTDFDQGMMLENYPAEGLMDVFRKLQKGIRQDGMTESLLTMMSEEQASELIELLIQEGIIE